MTLCYTVTVEERSALIRPNEDDLLYRALLLIILSAVSISRKYMQLLLKRLNIYSSDWSVFPRSVREPAVGLESWQDKYQQARREKVTPPQWLPEDIKWDPVCVCECVNLCVAVAAYMWSVRASVCACTACACMLFINAHKCLPNIWLHLSVWTFTQHTQVKTTTAK